MRAIRAFAYAALALLGATLLAVLLAGWAVIELQNGWQRERLRAWLESTANQALAEAGVDAKLRIGALEGALYPDVVLRDVALTRAGAAPISIARAELRLDLRALYGERRVVIEKLRIEGAELALARDPARGWPWEGLVTEPPSPEPLPVSVEVRAFELVDGRLAATWTQADLPSHVSGTLAASARDLVLPRTGTPPWPPEAKLDVALGSGSVAGRELRSAELALALDGSRLALSSSRLDSAFGKLQAHGTTDLAGWFDTSAPANVDLTVDAAALDLAVLLERPELAGQLTGVLRARASHTPGSELRASRADIELALAPSRFGKLALTSGDLRGVYDAGNWRLERAVLRSSAAQLDARGNGDLDRIAALEAKLDVSDLAALAALVQSDAKGKARAVLELRGAWRAPSGVLELDTRELRAAGVELGSLRLRARSEGLERYRIEPFALDSPRLALAADGPILLRRAGAGVRIEQARLRLAKDEVVGLRGHVLPGELREFEMDVERLSLARVGTLAGLETRLGGTIRGKLTANGRLPRPAIAGALTWDAPKLGEVEAERVTVELETRRDVLYADGRIAARGRELLTARAAIPWTARSDLAQILRSPSTSLVISSNELPLTLAQELLPGRVQNVEGAGSVRVEIRGDPGGPRLDGELEIARASADFPVLNQRLGPLDARIALTGDALRVEHFELQGAGGGAALVSGEIALQDLKPSRAQLDLALREYAVRWQTNLQAIAVGDVSVTGPIDALQARGAIELRGLRYSLAGGADPLLSEITVRDSRIAPREPQPLLIETTDFYDRATVDVAIAIANDGRVQGQGANLEIAGDLRAEKPPGKPLVLTGAIDTTSGSYRFQGRLFAIEQARVNFTGRPDFDPTLDVRAMHRVRNILVYALVTGRASAPIVRLTSDPPYPQDDVLALLLFGRTRDELGQQQAGALQAALAPGAGAAVFEKIGIESPVDEFDVESDEESGDPVIGVGRYLTQDIFVRYGQAIGPEAESSVRVNWRFHPHWSVETEIKSSGDSSADLIWNYDY
jgi:autotransporter translocation and assembly factor TamB